MKLERIRYEDLNAKQKEIFNYQKLAAELADYGFNCIKLADDWQGADFLAYHKDGGDTLKVQLKARITIARDYQGKDLWMAFPASGHWYLIKHDELLGLVKQATPWLDSSSWTAGGKYTAASPGAALIKALAPWRL